MNAPARMTSWLLLGLLTVVVGGAAALGVVQSPNNAPLQQAVKNTLAAPNYTEMLDTTTPNGSQTLHLVFQAPDRLGGYAINGNRRTYIFIIGRYEFQSLAVPAGGSDKHLTFYRQAGRAASQADPARGFLHFAERGQNVKGSAGSYTFTVTQNGVTGAFTATVSGSYVSAMTLVAPNESDQLKISQVGTSPHVALPSGSRVVG
ncbi:MAG: hypothetical protein ACRD1G_01485, partial [Acidimicrobiales bacterium]